MPIRGLKGSPAGNSGIGSNGAREIREFWPSHLPNNLWRAREACGRCVRIVQYALYVCRQSAEASGQVESNLVYSTAQESTWGRVGESIRLRVGGPPSLELTDKGFGRDTSRGK